MVDLVASFLCFQFLEEVTSTTPTQVLADGPSRGRMLRLIPWREDSFSRVDLFSTHLDAF